MNKRIATIPALLFTAMSTIFLYACTKYDDRLDTQNRDSGIVSVVKNGSNIGEAQIDEIVTVYAKIGEPGATIKMFVSGAEAEVVSHGQSTVKLQPATGAAGTVGQDTFNIIIPKGARIGAGSVYFSINGTVKPALPFTVKRPDILIPNKVFVEPYLFTYSDSMPRSTGGWEYIFPEILQDGSSRVAVVNTVMQLTYDQQSQTFYFFDVQPSDNTFRIRMLKNGMITTIAGGGNNYFASTANDLRIGAEGYTPAGGTNIDMEAGPDGKLYFTNIFTTEPDPVTGLAAAYTLMQSVDPHTGKVETIAGNNGRMIDYYYSTYGLNYRGLEDGDKSKAMIGSPKALTFDKNGDLCFLDGSALLRKLHKDGSIETLLGKVNRDVYEFEDTDGKMYSVMYYSAIEEHSDGFGDEVRFSNVYNMVQAGNGKFYILSSGAGWASNIIEVNLDTKEAATIIGQLEGVRTNITTGSFKEVELPYTITTFDVDYEGNILFGFNSITKIDLKAETVALIVTGTVPNGIPPPYTSQRQFMQDTHPGNDCILGRINRITFDQFGNLLVGYDNVAASADVRMVKVVIEK